MRILVTGGTGVVGRSTVTALLQRGHVVQLLSRHADRDVRQWSHGVNPVRGNIADAATIIGAADGCDAVLHLTAIVDEHGNQTFERVNVEGTRNVVREAERANVKKFVYVSSLGADRGESAYHRSKRQGEAIVRTFSGAWTVVRPGSVYGPGDEQISLLLRMVRTLPVLPILGGGDQAFQPVWHEDLAEALARAVERDDLAGRELDLAGPELTTQNELVQRLAKITGRNTPEISVPQRVAEWGVKLASMVGIEVPLNQSQLTMLAEGNTIAAGRENALTGILGVDARSLDSGLRALADTADEQLPDQGVGPLRRKRFWVDINGSARGPEQLMTYLREHFGDLMASFIDTQPEPGTSSQVVEDATLTLSLPVRGHIQVRVAEANPRVTTLVTLEGHPLAGAVRFLTEARGDDVRFEVQVFDRAAGVIDFVMMRTLGEHLQDVSWREMAEKVVKASGGSAPAGVQLESENLDEDQAELIEEWLRELVMERKRDEAGV
jgi:uncharacterized protein YbjT (DUF2867 family)